MPCASCGGGQALTPNRAISTPSTLHQSPQRLVTTPKTGASGAGFVTNTNPNKPTKRTQV